MPLVIHCDVRSGDEMAAHTLLDQAGELCRTGEVDLIYRYGHGTCCAEALFSDGAQWWYFYVSNLFDDALGQLIGALVTMLCYGEPQARAHWSHEPAESRWLLRRDGYDLHITVIELPDYSPSAPMPDKMGHVRLETTVGFWAFARRVRLAASRAAATAHGERRRRAPVDQDPGYRALCRLLAERRGRYYSRWPPGRERPPRVSPGVPPEGRPSRPPLRRGRTGRGPRHRRPRETRPAA
jgi:hypothetical protein